MPLVFDEEADGAIVTPVAGHKILFLSSDTSKLKTKDSTGAIVTISQYDVVAIQQSFTTIFNNNVVWSAPATTVYLDVNITGGDDAAILTGIDSTQTTKKLTLVCSTGDGDTITISQENVNSLEENRFRLAGGTDLILEDNDAASIEYDPVSLRWRVV